MKNFWLGLATGWLMVIVAIVHQRQGVTLLYVLLFCAVLSVTGYATWQNERRSITKT